MTVMDLKNLKILVSYKYVEKGYMCMSEVQFEIMIEGDSEGYVTFECPFCESEFKLRADEFQDENNTFTELYCPYCGLTDKVNTFYTKDVVAQVEALATNYMYEQIQ